MIEPRNIELIFYDFDGVITDKDFYLNQNGSEFAKLSRPDGL